MAEIIISKTVHRTLTAGIVDRISGFNGYCGAFQVWNRSALANADMYVRTDGIDPIPEGDGSYLVPPNGSRTFGAVVPHLPDIRIVSALAVKYSVECV
jgi:hypothetical protein